MTSFENKLKECEEDVAETTNLLSQATRANVRQLLQAQLEKLQTELTRLKKAEQDRLAKLSAPTTGAPLTLGAYTKKIDTYGWDQSDKFVKIYLTSLADVSKVKESDVTCDFTATTFDLTIRNLNNVNYNLTVSNLLESIEPSQSYVKCKTDSIVVFLKKLHVGKSWGYVTSREMKIKEKAAPKFDDKSDPQEGLMSMMKKMYDDGDDEMKRTISKAFSESREKSMRGGEADMGMGF